MCMWYSMMLLHSIFIVICVCASLTNGSVSVHLCSCVCELPVLAGLYSAEEVPLYGAHEALIVFVANSLFMFRAHQLNSSASDKSCKYMHSHDIL